MNEYIKTDCWSIIEDEFNAQRVKASESLFSIGNGIMGQRANFEERYSGDSLSGSYIGGVYYPDKTRVGWWKNGYPEYFAKVLNSTFWIGIGVTIDGEELDLARCQVLSFRRELDMKRGLLSRDFSVKMGSGTVIEVSAERFLSMERVEMGAIKYTIISQTKGVEVKITPYMDGDVRNEDANYDEKFWEPLTCEGNALSMRTKKTGFSVAWAQSVVTSKDINFTVTTAGEEVSSCGESTIEQGDSLTIYKYVGVCSSLNHSEDEIVSAAQSVSEQGAEIGYDTLRDEHIALWAERWHGCDIEIEGDDDSQQGIRYCIFMLLQTYTGRDSRLNIGPKGFTGEKYGGTTYWDTEAYCLSFYMSSVGADVARQLLIYRYNQLDKAIENGEKLGFTGGAALYPMVTANGEECHNEWEITFEEIHRNGAIAFAIYNYIRYTGDKNYLAEYGAEVLLSIARFWSQRITYSTQRGKYVMLGVTGPNEYENNVNNNWYTSYIALWCMDYAIQAAEWVRDNNPARWSEIVVKRNFSFEEETPRWRDIVSNTHLPYSAELDIFLQQDGYLDKEQILVSELDPVHRPLNQKWSWDRILRSCFIKQADVLQGVYLFKDRFDMETIKRNFYFYEARTVHESSLSPCVHAILAARIGDMDKAMEMYLRTSRLDLDDYNKEIDEGCHITSMAGSWLSVVEGFGGISVEDDKLSINPSIPQGWRSLKFSLQFRNRVISIYATHNSVDVSLVEGDAIEVMVQNESCRLTP